MTDLVPATADGVRNGRSAPAWRRWLPFRREPRAKVVRRGLIASLLWPLSVAASLILVVAALMTFGTTFWKSVERDRLFSAPTRPDASEVAVRGPAPLAEAVTVVTRDADGTLRRLLVEKSAADAFAMTASAGSTPPSSRPRRRPGARSHSSSISPSPTATTPSKPMPTGSSPGADPMSC
ncbi:hypothetical protein [Lutibaculum baratangense]|uniref:hypothetical protein n=1 Tax=Lutibaculum baratangense TaxID=1358440 RepID=UPI00058FB5F8|nr:hypothetical protein [Lutibaculum baratangense]